MRISDPTRFRRNVAGACLIAGPLLILIASIFAPTPTGAETEEYVSGVADNPGRQQVTSLLYYFGFALLVPGMVGVVHLLRARAVALGHIAGALFFLGVVGLAALSLTGIPDISITENAGPEEAVTIIDGIEDYAGAIAFIIVTLAGIALGLILLGLAAWRGGLAPAWLPVVIVLAVAGLVVGERAGEVIANALLLVAFGFLGWRILSMSDAEWERPHGEAVAPAAPPPR